MLEHTDKWQESCCLTSQVCVWLNTVYDQAWVSWCVPASKEEQHHRGTDTENQAILNKRLTAHTVTVEHQKEDEDDVEWQ